MVTWTAYLIEATTGRVGRRLDPAALTWSEEVNGPGGGSVTLKKSNLKSLDRRRYSAKWGGIIICYVDPWGVEHPYTGGPFMGKATETRTTWATNFAGLWDVFESRVIERNLVYRGTSYGNIAWALAREGMNKPGGALPLVRGTAPDTGTRERTYDAWNLSNNGIAKRWKELTEVIGGPDIIFRPQWADEHHTRVEWAMYHGTTNQPEIAQDWTPAWDTTAARTDVVDISITTDPDAMTSRVWGTGAGESETTVIVRADDSDLVARGFMFSEVIISDSDQAKPDPILAKAKGLLASSQEPVDQISLTVRADSPKNPLSKWYAGHAAYVTVGPEWEAVPAGRHLMRIVKVSGDLSNQISVEFQVEQLGG